MKISNQFINYSPIFTQKTNLNQTNFKGSVYKIPKYLYHITSANNYEVMKLTKKIMAGSEAGTKIKGVFSFDMENFLKCWNINDSVGCPIDMKLFDRASIDKKIVLLRIPTQNLDTNLFKIRSQNIIFDGEIQEKLLPELDGDERAKCIEVLKNARKHTQNPVSASEAQEYLDKNHAIEFIYQDDIPLDNVEVVGRANLYDFYNSPRGEFCKNVMKQLTQGQNEASFLD